jgi:organic radical activating enzyme
MWNEVPLDEVVRQARRYACAHAVITGGNPLLQVNELADLIVALKTPWVPDVHVDAEGKRYKEDPKHNVWRRGMHITVETQASIYDESIAHHADLMSLSPKLHVHGWEPNIVEYMRAAVREPRKKLQFKMVVGTERETRDAIDLFCAWFKDAHRLTKEERGGPLAAEIFHYILQPESSLGRKGVEMVRSTLERWIRASPAGFLFPPIRIIPQLHKSALYVR